MRRHRDALNLLGALALLGLLGLGMGCSTIANEPPPECEIDQDCGENLICSIAQGNICVSEVQPPLANLGFDIREGSDFRIELRGCDPEVSLEPGGNELRIRSRTRVARDFSFSVSATREVESCAECELGLICDSQALTCTGPAEAQLDFSQNSRFGLQPLASPIESYTIPVDPPLPEGELPPPVDMVWPKYDSDENSAHWATQLDVAMLEAGTTRGTIRRVVADAVEGSFELVNTQRCQRALFGDEGAVRIFQAGPLVDANLEFLYDEPIAAPASVIGPAQACSDSLVCPPGWACSDADTCALDLSGVSAGTTTSVADPLGGFSPAWLYTYCEGISAPTTDPLIRELFIRLAPPIETGLPQVVFRIDQVFADPSTPNSSRLIRFSDSLCVPPWQPPHTIAFSVQGEPVELTKTDLGSYRCCSADCLPTQGPDDEPTPPPSVDSCTNFETARFTTQWFLDDAQTWGLDGCTQPSTNSEGGNGRYAREVEKLKACSDTPCTVDLTQGEVDELDRLYEVELTQPTNSVFRSLRRQVTIGPDTLDFGEPFELEPRVLLRGQIICAAGSEANCNSVNAIVAAERLQVASDENDPLGPFFFQGRSDAEGNFVLPVEPGVYVVTGYPAIGQPGGPAPLQILDLRSDSARIELRDGVPNATLEQAIELDEGVLVRALAKDFDVQTGVTPIDLGSWTNDPAFDDFDLNAPETCHNASTRRGCVIRRLRPTDASISLLLSKRFQFTARTGGSNQCEP